MSDADLVKDLRSRQTIHCCIQRTHLHTPDYTEGRKVLETAADRIEALVAEVERLRKVAVDCAAAIGNGAALSSESSLEFIELLPGEISKHTDKLRRFLKCSRDEGTEALDRAESAERALAEALGHIAILANDMSDVVEAQYVDLKDYPSEARRYERDIAPVRAARDFITAYEKEKGS